MAGSPPNLHTMHIQGVLKVKVKVKDHVIRALFWIIGMSYSVIDGLVFFRHYSFIDKLLTVYCNVYGCFVRGSRAGAGSTRIVLTRDPWPDLNL